MRRFLHSGMSVRLKPLCGLSMVVAGITGLLLANTTNAQVFQWNFELNDPIVQGTVPLPTLNDASGASLAAFLAGQDLLAVKVVEPINAGTVAAFLDGPTPLTHIVAHLRPDAGLGFIQTEHLVFQNSGTGSSGASIGQFNLDPVSSAVGYAFTEVNTASPNLFPGGSPSRGRAISPNIRSGLFTKPIARLSGVSAATPDSDFVFPHVTRFNNFGNAALVNSEYKGVPAYETTDQLLSRGDYQALMTHFRMRGADGVIANNSGVAGYSQTELLEDTRDGWNFLDLIYEGDVQAVSLDSVLDLTMFPDKSFEEAGAAWSGAVGQTASGKDVLTILLSNLSDIDNLEIELPNELAGRDMSQTEFTVGSNDHSLLTFVLLGGDEWLKLSEGEAFDDDFRGGIGVWSEPGTSQVSNPEPSTALIAVVGIVAVGLRRRRGLWNEKRS